MAERYTRLFGLEKNLYVPGSPVLICSGVLLQDSYSNNLLAQLKFKNLSEKPFRALKLSVQMLDAAGAPLSAPIEHQYLDLSAGRDEEFGQKSALVLPERSARSYAVRVTEVLFADGERWLPQEGAVWAPLKPVRTLEEALGDGELADQYRVRYGGDCKMEPMTDAGLWLCACGALNSEQEPNCHRCRRKATAFKDVNLASLKKECADRLKAEQAQQEQDKEESRHRRKKQLRLAAVLLPLLLIAALLLATVPGAVQRSRAYEDAAALLEARSYAQAQEAFLALGDYRDSAEQAEKNVPYQKALYVMACAQSGDAAGLAPAGLSRSDANGEESLSVLLYRAAISQFEALGGYKDSEKNAALCRAAIDEQNDQARKDAYTAALALLEEEKYCEARDAFQALSPYEDSAQMAQEAIYRKALSLFRFMESYEVRDISCALSTETGTASRVSVPKAVALEMGEGFITQLKGAFGRDPLDILLEDEPAGDMVPFADGVSGLFASLGRYSESRDYIEKIAELSDYTRPFYAMCEQGDLYGAYDWLQAEPDFENREHWLRLLELYKPYCASWVLYSGDPTLISITAGKGQPCNAFSSCVLLSGDSAVLRLSCTGDEEFTVELSASAGETSFMLDIGDGFLYYSTISNVDHMGYLKYDSNGSIRSSCEYSRE